MKAKKNERKKQGHRQPYTKVEITSIKLAASAKDDSAEKVEVAEKKTSTKTSTTKTTTASKAKKTEEVKEKVEA